MAQFPDFADAEESRIINKLITRVLSEENMHIAVHDGEEFATPPTRDRAQIQRETFATDVTVYVLYTPSVKQPGKWKRHGTVTMVHGNGEDVLSDASAPHDEALDRITQIVWPK